MRNLMRKYRDLPMDLADAALVAVAERERISRIFTLDRKDFEIYRPTGIRRFEIIPDRRRRHAYVPATTEPEVRR